jgi:hypothetical protein
MSQPLASTSQIQSTPSEQDGLPRPRELEEDLRFREPAAHTMAQYEGFAVGGMLIQQAGVLIQLYVISARSWLCRRAALARKWW